MNELKTVPSLYTRSTREIRHPHKATITELNVEALMLRCRHAHSEDDLHVAITGAYAMLENPRTPEHLREQLAHIYEEAQSRLEQWTGKTPVFIAIFPRPANHYSSTINKGILLSLKACWDLFWLAQHIPWESLDTVPFLGKIIDASEEQVMHGYATPNFEIQRDLLHEMKCQGASLKQRDTSLCDPNETLLLFCYWLITESALSTSEAAMLANEVLGKPLTVEAWGMRMTRWSDKMQLPRRDGRRRPKRPRDEKPWRTVILSPAPA